MLRCRQLAAERAKGDSVTFIDSHAEVQPGWLEPMLAEVGRDSSRIAFPQLDWENPREWDIHKGGIGCVRQLSLFFFFFGGGHFPRISQLIPARTRPRTRRVLCSTWCPS